jgi:hypothetical protein
MSEAPRGREKSKKERGKRDERVTVWSIERSERRTDDQREHPQTHTGRERRYVFSALPVRSTAPQINTDNMQLNTALPLELKRQREKKR